MEKELLKKGDKVVMHTCLEAEKYNGKIWTCATDEYTKGEGVYKQNLVFLEGFSGCFAAEYLQKVELKETMLTNRKYVVVCNRYKGIAGSLLFWGRFTEDDEKRSFGGYDSNFNKCEKYTLEEIKASGYGFPIYGQDVHKDNYKKFEDFAIEIRRLKMLGYRPITIYYR